MTELILYTRVDCHLCEKAKAALERVRADRPFALKVVDVDSDPALASRYGLEVPVLLVDGKKWAKYHIDEPALRRRLESV